MLTLSIPDMHCNACKTSVERVLLPLADGAKVFVDLEQRRVTIGGAADAGPMIEALEKIGFPAKSLSTWFGILGNWSPDRQDFFGEELFPAGKTNTKMCPVCRAKMSNLSVFSESMIELVELGA
jgi:copper chaperone